MKNGLEKVQKLTPIPEFLHRKGKIFFVATTENTPLRVICKKISLGISTKSKNLRGLWLLDPLCTLGPNKAVFPLSKDIQPQFVAVCLGTNLHIQMFRFKD